MKQFIFFFLSLVGFLYSGLIYAQKPEDFGIKSKKSLNFYLQGETQKRYRAYESAAVLYEEALKIEPTFVQARFSLAECYFILEKTPKVRENLSIAFHYARNQNCVNCAYYMADTYIKEANYDSAAYWYSQFLNQQTQGTPQYISIAKRSLPSCKYAAGAMKHPIEYNPKNMGLAVNSGGHDYLPNLTADDELIFFTSRRNTNIGGFNRELKDYAEDFYYSIRKDGVWQEAVNLGPPVNTELNEGSASISPDAQTVYFTICNAPGGFGSCDLYWAEMEGTTWKNPQNLGSKVNSAAWESHPSISNDGKILYFSSSRPGGKGGADIWYVTKTSDGWSDPINIGEPINTPGDEYSPFIHADGQTLYFSSNTHLGMGGFDLFFSKKMPGGKWSSPRNLGYPLNTSADERSLFINAAGNKGYINANRPDSYGQTDLYEFDLDTTIRPEKATFLRGYVYDSLTKKPLYVQVTLINLATGDTVRQVHSNKTTGKFLLSLPLNQDYAAFVETPGYLFYSKTFHLTAKEESRYFELEIPLQPIQVGATIVLNNIFFETAKYNLLPASFIELSKVVTFMQKNARMRVQLRGHTDAIGTDADNLKLSQNRANSVREYLISKGIENNRLESIGLGETIPVADNNTEEGRALNRRTEFRILSIQ